MTTEAAPWAKKPTHGESGIRTRRPSKRPKEWLRELREAADKAVKRESTERVEKREPAFELSEVARSLGIRTRRPSKRPKEWLRELRKAADRSVQHKAKAESERSKEARSLGIRTRQPSKRPKEWLRELRKAADRSVQHKAKAESERNKETRSLGIKTRRPSESPEEWLLRAIEELSALETAEVSSMLDLIKDSRGTSIPVVLCADEISPDEILSEYQKIQENQIRENYHPVFGIEDLDHVEPHQDEVAVLSRPPLVVLCR